ncbi:hypothetical protein D1B31_03975 [Neobacillus notoginsengisoli]|uniref:Xylulokinase n=1 Tax=Neobacillus notoginsengisoli TaxID=1578198 RepID=A0A417YZ10_9BACI|nr:FGGY family carbohydrate kinase [Neobacillus notoginsengisoli]RHW42750.1 hypothetical protein D1B31_03975 [Neobacillus notoginsengisoli]
MSYVAAFDIGTTAIKGVLVAKDGTFTGETVIPLKTYHGENGEIEQNPHDWWEGVKDIAAHWREAKEIGGADIKMISFSGQMEDVIPIKADNRLKGVTQISEHEQLKGGDLIFVDKDRSSGTRFSEDRDQVYAILYSDTRAREELLLLKEAFPTHRRRTGNSLASSTPFAKILWLKKKERDAFTNTTCFLFSSKDYVIYRLTGQFVSDPVTCATTGMMDIQTKEWLLDCLDEFGVSTDLLPTIKFPDEVAGFVGAAAALESGFLEGTPVLCGSGDAGATTLGAAAVRNGDSYIYLGTTGWVAAASSKLDFDAAGIFNLAHMDHELYIRIAPLLNVGNIHRWAIETFIGNADEPYRDFEVSVESSEAGAGGLLFLPYLHGERGYIQDEEANGAFWGIQPLTRKADFLRAVIEGLSFSLKQTLDFVVGEGEEGSVTLIGGGTKSSTWCQALADILGKPIRVPASSEYLPALGAAASAFIRLGWTENYETFADQHIDTIQSKYYHPNHQHTEMYTNKYKQYLKLYPALKALYC